MQFIMPCQELVCFGTVESIHRRTVWFAFESYFLRLCDGPWTSVDRFNRGKFRQIVCLLVKARETGGQWKKIASLKFDNNLSNFAVVSARVKETKYFHFNLFSMAKKVNLIALARVLSCIINRLNRNFALIWHYMDDSFYK